MEVLTVVLAIMSFILFSLVIFNNFSRLEGQVKSSAEVVNKRWSWRSCTERSLTNIVLGEGEMVGSSQVMVLAGAEPYNM